MTKAIRISTRVKPARDDLVSGFLVSESAVFMTSILPAAQCRPHEARGVAVSVFLAIVISPIDIRYPGSKNVCDRSHILRDKLQKLNVNLLFFEFRYFLSNLVIYDYSARWWCVTLILVPQGGTDFEPQASSGIGPIPSARRALEVVPFWGRRIISASGK